jgi:ubiquinone/menaquinone biosynthesis C-methylase UbiE
LVSSGHWYEWVKTINQFVSKNDNILEVGFGTGILQDDLLERNFNVVGIDESRQMNLLCKKRNRKHQPNLKIVRGLVNSLPFSDHQFDKVISTFPSEYVYEAKFLDELVRTLKLDGKFIALTSVRFTGMSLLDTFYRTLFKITNQNLNLFIEQKNLDYWKVTKSFSYEVQVIKYHQVELSYIILSR